MKTPEDKAATVYWKKILGLGPQWGVSVHVCAVEGGNEGKGRTSISWTGIILCTCLLFHHAVFP